MAEHETSPDPSLEGGSAGEILTPSAEPDFTGELESPEVSAEALETRRSECQKYLDTNMEIANIRAERNLTGWRGWFAKFKRNNTARLVTGVGASMVAAVAPGVGVASQVLRTGLGAIGGGSAGEAQYALKTEKSVLDKISGSDGKIDASALAGVDEKELVSSIVRLTEIATARGLAISEVLADKDKETIAKITEKEAGNWFSRNLEKAREAFASMPKYLKVCVPLATLGLGITMPVVGAAAALGLGVLGTRRMYAREGYEHSDLVKTMQDELMRRVEQGKIAPNKVAELYILAKYDAKREKQRSVAFGSTVAVGASALLFAGRAEAHDYLTGSSTVVEPGHHSEAPHISSGHVAEPGRQIVPGITGSEPTNEIQGSPSPSHVEHIASTSEASHAHHPAAPTEHHTASRTYIEHTAHHENPSHAHTEKHVVAKEPEHPEVSAAKPVDESRVIPVTVKPDHTTSEAVPTDTSESHDFVPGNDNERPLDLSSDNATTPLDVSNTDLHVIEPDQSPAAPSTLPEYADNMSRDIKMDSPEQGVLPDGTHLTPTESLLERIPFADRVTPEANADISTPQVTDHQEMGHIISSHDTRPDELPREMKATPEEPKPGGTTYETKSGGRVGDTNPLLEREGLGDAHTYEGNKDFVQTDKDSGTMVREGWLEAPHQTDHGNVAEHTSADAAHVPETPVAVHASEIGHDYNFENNNQPEMQGFRDHIVSMLEKGQSDKLQRLHDYLDNKNFLRDLSHSKEWKWILPSADSKPDYSPSNTGEVREGWMAHRDGFLFIKGKTYWSPDRIVNDSAYRELYKKDIENILQQGQAVMKPLGPSATAELKN
ncbi:MAG: hypothetical protein NTW50_02190 [Candidatus Berkelbacteria bacterium]|nr:hypothetical protein [Candidatus Berkelbacteria bacterium]